jgi:hypothetical protein
VEANLPHRIHRTTRNPNPPAHKARLPAEREPRLEEDRIGKQADDASEIAGDREPVGVATARSLDLREPVLQQRRSAASRTNGTPTFDVRRPSSDGTGFDGLDGLQFAGTLMGRDSDASANNPE